MGQALAQITLASSDAGINEILHQEARAGVGYSTHYNQSEEMFLRLGRHFQVPAVPIHHDIRDQQPGKPYITALRELVDHLYDLVPGVFSGLTHLFDPSEVLRPLFFQVYRVAGALYLYTLRLDLVYRAARHEVVDRGSNDTTPHYRTDELIVEPTIIPLHDIARSDGTIEGFTVDQLVDDTWIGETGRGYFVTGIWIDADLTKFFSKLFLRPGKRLYPYYPFNSRYRTMCHSPSRIDVNARRTAVPVLHRAKGFLEPHIKRIETVLREKEFSESLDEFTEIKATVPDEWYQWFDPIRVQVYLNADDQKEFELHVDDGEAP